MYCMSKSPAIRLVIVDDHEVVRIGLCAVLNLTPGLKSLGRKANGRRQKALRSPETGPHLA